MTEHLPINLCNTGKGGHVKCRSERHAGFVALSSYFKACIFKRQFRIIWHLNDVAQGIYPLSSKVILFTSLPLVSQNLANLQKVHLCVCCFCFSKIRIDWLHLNSICPHFKGFCSIVSVSLQNVLEELTFLRPCCAIGACWVFSPSCLLRVTNML